MKKPELLAPVGNIECLYAAVNAGCDAVYLSGKLYGARSYAGNFDNDELVSAIKYCHLYGVKVYVTINTLIYDAEVEGFIKYVDFLHKNGVDAVIIQDIGMFDLLHKLYPNLELHASTQMHIHNLEGTIFMEELGASRVVLARETPIELIKEIKENTNIELEIFVHGALCISYSGQCLMSSLIGGRSGNRGTCAQCCRQSYSLEEDNNKIYKNKYLLSTRDLNSLDNIGKLIDIGVDSLKIEGRMKRPEYVFYVVSLYRKAIDSYIKNNKVNITEEELTNLKKIFNREFTKGFLFNDLNKNIVNSFRPNHLGIEIGKVIESKKGYIKIKLFDNLNVQDGIRIIDKEDYGMTIQTIFINNKKVDSATKGDIVTIKFDKNVSINSIVLKTTDKLLMNNIDNLIKNGIRKVNINIDLRCLLNEKMHIHISDNTNEIDLDSEYIVQSSLNKPTSKEDIKKQISKLGDTIYNIENINIECDNNIFIPVKFLNDLRREAIEKLNEKRLYIKEYLKGEYSINVSNFEKEKLKVLELRDNYKIDNNYDEIIVPFDSNINNPKVRKKLLRVNEYPIKLEGNIMVGELGSLKKNIENKNILTDFSLNVTNSYSVAFLHSIGVNRITLSVEMNEYQIKRLIEIYNNRYNKLPNLEVIVSGYLESMILKYDLLEGLDKSKKHYLVDKYNNKFEVVRKNNLTTIYDYKKLKINSNLYDIGINSIREIK